MTVTRARATATERFTVTDVSIFMVRPYSIAALLAAVLYIRNRKFYSQKP